MMRQPSRRLGAAPACAALLAAFVGLTAAPGQEPDTARPPAGKVDADPPSPDDQVEALVRQYEEVMAALMRQRLDSLANVTKSRSRARPPGKYSEAQKSRMDIVTRLLELAERHPRTNAAEQALTLTVCSNRGPLAERAREILARDYIRSDRIKAILAETPSSSEWSSPATENLLRRALERSPYHEIRGLACYRLAEILIERAERVRAWRLLGSPPRSDHFLIRGGPEVVDLLRRSDPARLEAEAASLLERMVAEFSWVRENQGGRNGVGTALGEPAKSELDRLRRLSIGKPAPEIVGVDFDGKPMKLSDYRGKVVLLYFSPNFSPLEDHEPSLLADKFRKLSTTFAGQPFAIVGVIAFNLHAHRKSHRAGDLPGRFWADEPTRDQPGGRIHSAWDVTGHDFAPTHYVLDPGGTIRYKLPDDPALIEKAVTTLLDEPARAGRGD